MDRREFLKAIALSGTTALFPGISGWALSKKDGSSADKKLVVIFLRGGADGLNIVVPYSDPNYYSLRPTMGVAKPGTADGVIDLDGHWGLNPALDELKPYWENKSLAFVHSSGSPNETRSHFDAQDYMETGVPGKKIVNSGWLNRVVTELPSRQSHLQALSFGAVLPRIFSGPATVASVARPGSQKMALDKPVVAQAFQELYAARNNELSKAFAEGVEAHKAINKALEEPEKPQDMEQVIANKGAPTPKVFKTFGKQLSDLFNKDEGVEVAFVDFGGWDTHVNEGNGKGQLANHLKPLGTGLSEFITGIGPMYKNTTIVVMSEFGRSAHENGNGGTDHGHGNVMWMLGGDIPGGKVYGKWKGLAVEDLHERRDLPTSTDFRSVISYVLSNHVNVSQKSLVRIFPDFQNVGDPLVT